MAMSAKRETMEVTFAGGKTRPLRSLPLKRFGLFTVGKEGQPDALLGRFDSYYELIARCRAEPDAAYLVEVAHYAFLKVEDFASLFGPLPRAECRSA